MDTLLTKIIIGISIFWVIFIIVYAYKNDFSSEIISFFLPALGAILLSFFVGIKFIYFDAPKDPEITCRTVVVLHDKLDNTLYGVALNGSEFSSENLNQSGLCTINSHINAEMLEKSGLKLLLQKDPIGSQSNNIQENDSLYFSNAVRDCVEYNIIEWFVRINSGGSWFNKEYIYNLPNGFSHQAVSMTDSSMISEYKIDKLSFPHNTLFRDFPLISKLPSGGKIIPFKQNDYKSGFIIKTDYSEIEFAIQQISMSGISKDKSDIFQRIKVKEFDRDNRNLTLISYQVEIKQKFNKFSRFSKEAKLHPEWQKLLINKFNEAFTYESFKNKL